MNTDWQKGQTRAVALQTDMKYEGTKGSPSTCRDRPNE